MIEEMVAGVELEPTFAKIRVSPIELIVALGFLNSSVLDIDEDLGDEGEE
jgi:hypothetical protein